jgi:thiamine-monophosphate kinase
MKVKDIGEFGLINRISKKAKDKDVIVGIGDDAAVIKTKGLQVLTTDCLVEGDHFRRDWFTPEQIGMKAIEINVSDVAAMGAIPKYVLVSLALPHDIEVEFVEKMYKGMWKICDKYKVDIIGGNMTHSNQIMISITLTGIVDEKNMSLRSGAKPGDFVFVSGYIGNGRAGLRVFQEKLKGFYDVREKYLQPKARLDFSLKIAPYANSMIDISDGLAPEIKHICDESKCGAIIYKEKIPISDEVRKVAKTLGEDEYNYALFGGEDFELAYTVSKENIDKIQGFIVGEITKNKEIILSLGDKKEKIEKSGYDHFSNSVSS